MRYVALLAGLLVVAAGVFAGAGPVRAADMTVDSTADAVDADPGDGTCASAAGACTLRAAIQEANALPGDDTITVPEGVYTLTLAGSGEDAAATGDLDIAGSLTIVGAGAETTVVDGGGLDRVFDVLAGADPPDVAWMDLTIQRGLTGVGGGVWAAGGTLRFERVVLQDNEAESDGGGIYARANVDLLTLESVTVRRNVAGGAGGGLLTQTTTVVRDSLFLNNTSGGNLGGGAHAAGELTLERSVIADNVGQGLRMTRFGSLRATNVTVSGNQVNQAGGAAGIELGGEGAPHTLTHVTIANNLVGLGVRGYGAIATFSESIISGNAAGDCLEGSIDLTPAGANLDSDGSCGFSLTADPALAPLGYWGGPPGMLTHALGSLSPAIDAASTCGASEDQRGEPRPQGAACDLGAYEATPAEAVEVVYPSGFSTLGWVGGAATVEEAFADVLDQLEGVWAWDADAQEFLTWRPNLPPALNTLTTLAPGTGLWIRLTDGGTASVPTLAEGDAFVTGDAFGAVVVPTERLAAGGACTAPERSLAAGFNLVAWQGGTANAADALAGLGATLQGAWLWDGASESYLTYNPTLPSALNSLAEIRAGQSLWLRVSATTVLTGPPAC